MSSHRMDYLLHMAETNPHRPPTRPFTVAEAHAVMRSHLECRAVRCPRKGAALIVLREAGKVVPDPDWYVE